jgi:DNA polymerase-3 subunit epsilon
MFDIKIEKPLVFFDLETTGVSIQNDRIVEISLVKFTPDGEKEVKTRRINPEMPIPPDATAIHGITDADVADSPTFKSISKSLYLYLEGCDMAGYNIAKFDMPLLAKEFSRSQLEFSASGRKIIDPYIIFCQMEPRSLSAAYKFYCGKEIENAHSAEGDILATIDVLEGQLAKYPDLPKDILSLHEFCGARDSANIDGTGKFKWQNNEAVIGFGRNAGTSLKKMAVDNPGFLRWIINSDFPDDAKEVANNALKGTFPEKA